MFMTCESLYVASDVAKRKLFWVILTCYHLPPTKAVEELLLFMAKTTKCSCVLAIFDKILPLHNTGAVSAHIMDKIQ